MATSTINPDLRLQPAEGPVIHGSSPDRIGRFLRVVVDQLWTKPDGLPAREVLDSIPTRIALTDHERGTAEGSGIPRYEKLVRFGTVPLVKAGWLVKRKGRWFLTPRGREACRKFHSANEFYREADRLFNEALQARPYFSLAVEEAEEQAWAQIRDYLLALSQIEFLGLVEALLKAMGYHIPWTAPPGKDHGLVDMIATPDPLGAHIPAIKVHARHLGQATLSEGLNSFLKSLGKNDLGLFIASGGFSPDARELARQSIEQRVTLLDLEEFVDHWIEYYDRLTPTARQRFPLKPVYFLLIES